MTAFHPPLRPTPPHSSAISMGRSATPRSTAAISSTALTFPLSAHELSAVVRNALDEDAAFHDVTTQATVDRQRQIRARVVARQPGVIAGLALATEAFQQLDELVTIQASVEDGARVAAGAVVLHLTGQARGVLSAERTALNFLQHLSGIATLTAAFVDAIAGTPAQILDTRKTTPGWRKLEKYAVRAGGGANHRSDLQSGVLIKDNHLEALGGDVALAVARAREHALPGTPIQVECDTLAQVEAAIAGRADWVLLDNMSLEQLREAVTRCAGQVVTEASGGVTRERVRAIAETGVQRISIGALTHSAPALDLGLDFDRL